VLISSAQQGAAPDGDFAGALSPPVSLVVTPRIYLKDTDVPIALAKVLDGLISAAL